jgi:uncharacterized radical SAM superfamily Fe-S cluster-containing enzyme
MNAHTDPATLHVTHALCRVCKNALPARVVARDGAAWLEKTCPKHGAQSVKVAASAEWYLRTRSFPMRPKRGREVSRPVDLGCPFDCGPCTSHQVDLAMPVVTITSSCNLDCPICYVHNKNDDAWHMPLDDFGRTLEHIVQAKGGRVDLLNLTGGEPMMHPRFFELVELARSFGISRISACTNGLEVLKPGVPARLHELGVRVAMSFDTFDSDVDMAMQGASLLKAKLRCLDLLDEHGVDVTLIPVMTRGYNDQELGAILQLAMARRCVRHVEVHTITYTGQGGVAFDRRGRICMDEVLAEIDAQVPWLSASDFVPSPWAHPLCYQIACLLVGDDGPPIPFTRFLDPMTFHGCLTETLYLEPTAAVEVALRDAIDRLWASDEPDAERTLRRLKAMLNDAFPADRELSYDERLRASEKHIKAIYLHSHMDEESLDMQRLAACCDASCYPDGSRYPVCAYNILYREKDPAFVKNPPKWGARTGGVRP